MKILAFILIILLITNFANCSNDSAVVEVKIGVVLPFSIDDELDSSMSNGGLAALKIALDQLRINGVSQNMNITLIPVDSWYKNLYTSVAQSMIVTKEVIEQGVVGIIGDLFSVQTIHSALISSELKIPQCSFSAGSILLNNRAKYPYFYRATENVASRTIDVFIPFIQHAKWTRIGLIYSDEALGQGVAAHFAMNAKAVNIDIVEVSAIPPRDTVERKDYVDIVHRIYEKDVRILVLIGLSEVVTPVLIEYYLQGYNIDDLVVLNNNFFEGLELHDTIVYWFNNTNTLTGKNMILSEEEVEEWMGFFIDGIFFTSAHEQPITEPLYSLWNISVYEHEEYALNVNYGEAYTCMYSMIVGFNKLIQSLPGNRVHNIQRLANRELNRMMTLDLFSNISGTAYPEFKLDELGNRYSPGILVNIDRNFEVLTQGNLKADGSYEYSPTLYFRGNRSAIPVDKTPEYSRNIRQYSANWYAVTVISGIFLALIFLTLVLFFLNRRSKFIRNTIPSVSYARLIGLCFVYLSCLISVNVPTPQVCFQELTTQSIGFSLLICSSYVKTFHLYRLTSRHMAISTSNLKVLIYITVMVVFLAGINITGALISPISSEIVKLDRYSYMVICYQYGASNIIQQLVFFGYGILVVSTAYYSYKTLTFPDLLQDKNIFPVMMTVIGLGSFFIPLWIAESKIFVEYFQIFKIGFKLIVSSFAFILLYGPLWSLGMASHIALFTKHTNNASANFSVYDRNQSFWAMRAVIDKTNSSGFCIQGCYKEEFAGPFAFLKKIFYGKWYRSTIFKPTGEKIVVVMNLDREDAIIFNIRNLIIGGHSQKDDLTRSNFGSTRLSIRASQRLAHRMPTTAPGSDTLLMEYKGKVYKFQFENASSRQQLEDNIINWNEIGSNSSQSVIEA
jgi:hypothetical protein